MDLPKPVSKYLAVDAATAESVYSQLPGREDGPADAYRHLLWSGELTRRFGPDEAKTILDLHEVQGSSSILSGGPPQRPAAEAMDRHNNDIGIEIGRDAKDWPDVIKRAQDVMDGSNRSGDGRDGGAVWLPEPPTGWMKNPVTGSGSPAPINWPNTDWEGGQVRPEKTYDYPYGGPIEATPGLEGVPLDPIISGDAGDQGDAIAKQMMASNAYWNSSDPAHGMTRAAVDLYYRDQYGTDPVETDATGRTIDPSPRRSGSGGSVHVRAYVRNAGSVHVSDYNRSPPTRS